MSSSKSSTCWFHPYMWTICFFCWYQFFCATFLGLISCSWYIIILLITPFLVIWFLSVSSLYRCLYTRPPLIPHTYLVPQRILNLLNKQEKRCFQGSDTNLNYVSMGDCESSTEQQELFYKQVTEMAEDRKLNVQTSPMIFGNEMIQCPNVCMTCYIVKPDRVHHCRRCGRCIMRMDHHCPAIGKCVHLGNHKFFLIFLAYATLFCIYIFCSTVPLLINESVQFYTLHPPKQRNHHEAFSIPFALSIVGCCAAFGTPFYLIWFQWSLWADLFKNRTILEDLAVETGHTAVTTNKYDLGSRYKNFEAIFGEQKWHWFLPLHTTESQLNVCI